jgi:hypothetical protein
LWGRGLIRLWVSGGKQCREKQNGKHQVTPQCHAAR